MPPRVEGKGSCTQGYGTGDLPDQGKKLRVSNPTRPRPAFVDAVSRRAPQGPSLRAANHNMSVYCYRGPSGRQLLGVAYRDLSVERQRGPSGRQLLGAACRDLSVERGRGLGASAPRSSVLSCVKAVGMHVVVCHRARGQVLHGPAYNVAAGRSHLRPPPGEWIWRVEKALQDRPCAPPWRGAPLLRGAPTPWGGRLAGRHPAPW